MIIQRIFLPLTFLFIFSINASAQECVDSDGDGWGWDGTQSCRTNRNTINESSSNNDDDGCNRIVIDLVGNSESYLLGGAWGFDYSKNEYCKLSDFNSNQRDRFGFLICTENLDKDVGFGTNESHLPDGWAFDGNDFCRLKDYPTTNENTFATVNGKYCVDHDNDGWGFDGEYFCQKEGKGKYKRINTYNYKDKQRYTYFYDLFNSLKNLKRMTQFEMNRIFFKHYFDHHYLSYLNYDNFEQQELWFIVTPSKDQMSEAYAVYHAYHEFYFKLIWNAYATKGGIPPSRSMPIRDISVNEVAELFPGVKKGYEEGIRKDAFFVEEDRSRQRFDLKNQNAANLDKYKYSTIDQYVINMVKSNKNTNINCTYNDWIWSQEIWSINVSTKGNYSNYKLRKSGTPIQCVLNLREILKEIEANFGDYPRSYSVSGEEYAYYRARKEEVERILNRIRELGRQYNISELR